MRRRRQFDKQLEDELVTFILDLVKGLSSCGTIIEENKDIITPHAKIFVLLFQEVPKIELHLHLDCSLSFDVVSKIDPTKTKEQYLHEFVAPPKCHDLLEYLDRRHRH